MVEVKNVSKTFQTVTAVDNLSLTAEQGEIYGLIGPNGAGKTTTIRMIMNVIAPDTGDILFDGKRITERDKDRIGYLPEERGLYKKLKVNDSLVYLASLKGAEGPEVQKRIDSWLERFDLVDWKVRKVDELSKGMAQKVQFIGSIAHDPDIVFFDEPFSGLDPVSSDVLLQSILDLGKQGKTILFSTHIMEQAEKICTRILLMNKGKEVTSGKIQEVKERFGRRAVTLEFEGDGGFIKALPCVEHVIPYPRWIEAEIAEGFTPDDLLAAIVGKVSVLRFELVQPSLHKIFVSLAGQPQEEGNA